jgi:hypothetical protein
MTEPTNESLAALADTYVIEDEASVAAFLKKHSEIAPALEATVPYLEKYFPGAKRALTVEWDEDDDGVDAAKERLYVLVSAPPDVADINQRLDRLDEEWGYELCESTDELVIIDLDYT